MADIDIGSDDLNPDVLVGSLTESIRWTSPKIPEEKAKELAANYLNQAWNMAAESPHLYPDPRAHAYKMFLEDLQELTGQRSRDIIDPARRRPKRHKGPGRKRRG